MLTRYWFEFEKSYEVCVHGLQIGCGVTAYTFTDAINILSGKIFKNTQVPPINKCVENIDVRTLDQGHVIPNMWSPGVRGIWYPSFYHDHM